MLQVVDVKKSHQVRRFLDLSWKVYGDPSTRWVPPLWVHYRQMMGGLDDPEKRFLMALRDGEPVARVGVKIRRQGEAATLNFGFFECLEGEDDAVRLLLDEAHRLAAGLPMRGPFHFRQEDVYSGLLVEGFDHDPFFLMPYNPPHYVQVLERAGFSKLKDLWTFEFTPGETRGDALEGRAQRAREHGVEVRTLDRTRLADEVHTMVDIFNDALSDNWGFEPFEDDQVQDLLLLARFLLNPAHVWLARRDGRDIGALITLPNLNPLLKASRGRLTPRLALDYLQRKQKVDSFRGYALGVRRAHQASGASSALVHAMLTEGQQTRWRAFEVGWVLEDNRSMNALALAMGGRRTKVYRTMERPPR